MTSPRAERAMSRAGLLLGSVLAGWSAAFPASAETIPSPLPPGAMLTGSLTSQPIGHYEFCKARPAECSIRPRDTRPARMTDALWEELVNVNLSVNRAVKPMNDIDIYGKDEVWAYPAKGKGDCEDYALEKRRELNAAGLSFADLLITVVKKPDGEGHAVLTVRTDEGDFILDNLNNAVKPWEETGYRFLKRQSADNTGRWVAIRDGQTAPMVAAVKAVK